MSAKYQLAAAVAVFASILVSSSANADDSGAANLSAMDLKKRAFIGLTGGAAYASITHPLVVAGGFSATTLGLHAGYNVTERWSVGFEFIAVEETMSRNNAGDPFTPASLLKPQAGCTNCEPLPTGGWVTEAAATFGTLGPRVEFSPFGRDGLYLGVTTGLGAMLGIDTQIGFGGAARAGYRVRVAEVLGLAVEGGVQGQYFSDGTAVFPYASIMMRPYF